MSSGNLKIHDNSPSSSNNNYSNKMQPNHSASSPCDDGKLQAAVSERPNQSLTPQRVSSSHSEHVLLSNLNGKFEICDENTD